MRRFSLLLVIFVFSTVCAFAQNAKITQGSLYAVSAKGGELGACPLKHTKVVADISGFLTRVTVTQEFENNFDQPIEAIYTFPLSQNSAVDDMTMRIGERTIRGRIMKREEARQVYEAARAQGKTASLLDQQRPNIFTQAVANIMPNEKIVIEISYVETLKYEDGVYEFVFPMVVGPRYIPASMSAADAQRISPPVASERAGHDISIEVNLDGGVPVEEIRSNSHEVTTTNKSSNAAKISLKNERTIPNKDFVLRYDVTGKRIEDAILTHRAASGGFFSLILSPPENFSAKDVTPKEIVFVLDTSGSMSGFPIEKAKEAMKLSLDGLNPQDTFNLITFSGETSILFDKPVPATPANLYQAQEFLASRRGSGGTEMMKAIKAALEPSKSQTHVRIVCFMTDGYVGNEAQIIAEIQKYENARIFSFGIGNSVNRFLLDKMAQEGRGEVEYVSLKDDGSAAAKRFHERIRSPLLTDISIDWNGLPVADVYPKRNSDLFSAKPVIIHGRYAKAASGTIRLKGKAGGQDLIREIPVVLPDVEIRNNVLATLWARKKVDELMSGYYGRTESIPGKKEIQEQITQVALEFRLLTQFTSFVAVEERIVNQNGQPMRVEVHVELPDGVNRATTLGDNYNSQSSITSLPTNTRSFGNFESSLKMRSAARPESASGSGMGQGSGNGSGSGTGIVAPPPPASQQKVTSGETTGASQDISSVNALTIDGKQIEKPPVTNEFGNSALVGIFQRYEAHQKALTSLRANIVMTKYNSKLAETDVQEGVVSYMPEKNDLLVRVDWTKPTQEIFSLVKGNIFIYRPRLNVALVAKLAESQKNAVAGFINLSREKLAENHNIKYLGRENVGGNVPAWRLELTPKAQANYKTIEIWIDTNGMPIQAKITEANGDWTNIYLGNLQKNTTVNISDFRIALPKETKIIRK